MNWIKGLTGTMTALLLSIFLSIPFAYGESQWQKPYREVLAQHVKEGKVDYTSLQANPRQLEEYLTQLSHMDMRLYEKMTDRERLALWINAYNAITLKVIIDHYPIQSRGLFGFIAPKNSIRQIPGVWDKIKYQVIGEELTLNDIEHKILRKKFIEPRIHVALVCASNGCPELRGEPYEGEKLDEQLSDQMRTFLSQPQNFKRDLNEGKVYLSSIFKWFRSDFQLPYDQSIPIVARISDEEKNVILFLLPYVDFETAGYLKKGEYKIEYLDYDWSLNDQKVSA